MSAPSGTKLYTPELLGLAVALADYPLEPELTMRGEARSRSCGSSVEVGLTLAPDEAICAIGLRVTACAVGQAAAAIFARSARGKTVESLSAALVEIEQWLAGRGPLPTWPGFMTLAPAREHVGRHGAIVLPWRAADAALCKKVPTS